MLIIETVIKVNDFELRGAIDIEIESGRESLTDTAKIRIPNKSLQSNAVKDFGVINSVQRGSKIEIWIGYRQCELQLRFKGYVAKTKNTSNPIEWICEDEMYRLKQNSITKSWKSVSLKQLVSEIVPQGIEVVCPSDVQLGSFRIQRATAAETLSEIRKHYHLPAFFRGGKLYVGLHYHDYKKTHALQFGTNIVNSELDFRDKDDVKIKVKGISIQKDSKKIEYEDGASDGEERTITKFGLNLEALKLAVKNELHNVRYTGYRGSLTIFGEPCIQQGDAVRIIDPENRGRDGTYLVKKVVTSLSVLGGLRQKIELDIKVN